MTNTTSRLRPLGAGDVVTFDFPDPDGGSKTRACLVLHEDPATGELIVVYGTSHLGLHGHPEHAFVLRERCLLAQAGLRLQLPERHARLPQHSLFAERAGIHPVIGRRPPQASRQSSSRMRRPQSGSMAFRINQRTKAASGRPT